MCVHCVCLTFHCADSENVPHGSDDHLIIHIDGNDVSSDGCVDSESGSEDDALCTYSEQASGALTSGDVTSIHESVAVPVKRQSVRERIGWRRCVERRRIPGGSHSHLRGDGVGTQGRRLNNAVAYSEEFDARVRRNRVGVRRARWHRHACSSPHSMRRFGHGSSNTMPVRQRLQFRQDVRRMGHMKTTESTQGEDVHAISGSRSHYVNNVPQAHRALRTKIAAVREVFARLQLPPCMLRAPGARAFDESLLPSPTAGVELMAVRTFGEGARTDHVRDTFVKRMAQRSLKASSIIDMSMPLRAIETHYTGLRSFFADAADAEVWMGIRKETMAAAGLVTLTAFLEETICWLQLCQKHGDDAMRLRGDVLSASAQFLSKQLMFKLAGLASCYLPDDNERGIVQNVCRLVATGETISAGAVLQELALNFRFGILVAYALTPSVFTDPNVPRGERMCAHFGRLVDEYQPGRAMGLLNRIVRDHALRCCSRACIMDTRIALLSSCKCTGLFFFPLDCSSRSSK
uniref:Post-transcriptional regulator n=1 Tax=Otarine gammaherpesvirus 4 TaxID=2801541 RepID=A0A889IW27_9GAMA|nr:Post-transcriptional regulator [Otarine gammaherpesvirus 4]